MPDFHKKYLIRQALDPNTGQIGLEIKIRADRIQGMAKRNNKDDEENAITLIEALRNPNAIFGGLRLDDDPAWFCYAYRPVKLSSDRPENRVFLVFINADMVAYNWDWAEADSRALSRGEYLPDDYKSRFRK